MSILWVIMVSVNQINLFILNMQKPAFAGFTPLMKSAVIGNEEFARRLVEKRANVNATNDDGDSALNLAAKSSKNHFYNIKLYNFFCD